MLVILLQATTGGKQWWEALLISPLLPNAKRELLGKFRTRLATVINDNGWLVGCRISMDKLVMVKRRGGNNDGDIREEEKLL
jgi:hypothetical protein